jgi:cob(I)alamin adenosyltransferase
VKLYTKTGDGGDTSFLGGTRVRKSDPRVEAYGAVDELNAFIGFACTLGRDAEIVERLSAIQRDLFALGARLADPGDRVASKADKAQIATAEVERLEGWIDHYDAEVPPLRRFILPGGSQLGAALHLSRTVCRRAERRMVALEAPAVDPVLIAYINRLSDLLFVMARAANHRAKAAEAEW